MAGDWPKWQVHCYLKLLKYLNKYIMKYIFKSLKLLMAQLDSYIYKLRQRVNLNKSWNFRSDWIITNAL